MSLQHLRKPLGGSRKCLMEKIQAAGKKRKRKGLGALIDGLIDGWMGASQGGWEGWLSGCNGGERRAGKAK